jgi:hypothetical protein
MVTESRSRDQSTFVGQPVPQPSSTMMPDTRPNLSMLRDELLPTAAATPLGPEPRLKRQLDPGP